MTEPEAFRDIDLQVTRGIATISFARPRFLNAVSENLLRELLTTLYSLEHRDGVGVIVVRGTGAGQDAHPGGLVAGSGGLYRA